MISIGCDIAKNMCGFAIYDNARKKVLLIGHCKLWADDVNEMLVTCERLLLKFKPLLDNYEMKEWGIELSNFSNPKMTCEFSRIVGVLCGLIYKMFDKKFNLIKIFNANEWYQWMGNLKDVRADRKANTKKFVREHMGIISDSEHENDACAIAYWTPNCLNTYERHNALEDKKNVCKNSKSFRKPRKEHSIPKTKDTPTSL